MLAVFFVHLHVYVKRYHSAISLIHYVSINKRGKKLVWSGGCAKSGEIMEVEQHWDRLVLGWVTTTSFHENSRTWTLVRLWNSPFYNTFSKPCLLYISWYLKNSEIHVSEVWQLKWRREWGELWANPSLFCCKNRRKLVEAIWNCFHDFTRLYTRIFHYFCWSGMLAKRR